MKKHGFIKKLNISLEDTELLEVSKNFLVDLEKHFNAFQEEYQKNVLEWKSYVNHKDFVFEPEKLTKKSPLTIINAPWGSGKTFFIENFIKLFIDHKLESQVFKKIIIIDAWKFSNSKDVPVEFAVELSNKIINIQINNEETYETKQLVKQKILNWIIPDSLTWKLNLKVFSLEGRHTNKNLEKIENKENEKKAEEIWKEIQENKDPTIIFIDNIERLGSSSWDLLKAILKVQEFTNFLIILPSNLNKFNNNEQIDKSEYPIEKYIDFNYYNLQQDYSNFFNKFFKNNHQLINKLNLIFDSEVNGEKLSIREVENSFKKFNLFKIKDEYEILKIIREKIWTPKETFNRFLKEDAQYFLELERKKCLLFLEVRKKAVEKDKKGNFINISESHLKNANNIYSWEEKQGYWYKPCFDYLKEYNNLLSETNFKKEENAKEKENITSRLNASSQEKQEFENEKKKLMNEITDWEKKVKSENEKLKGYDPIKHTGLQNSIDLAKKKLEEIESEVKKIDKEINSFNDDLNFLIEINNEIFDISPKIVELNNINNNDKMSKNQKEEILLVLNNSFEKLNEKIENNFNFDLSKISF